jgi:hypothetical protein
MLGSQTQKVLQHTTIPVLVSAIESNMPHGELSAARDHRRRAPLARGCRPRPRVPVREARDGRAAVRSRCCARWSTTSGFPEKLHHPKEDAYLFRKLRERTSECDDYARRARAPARRRDALVGELERSLDRVRRRPATGFDGFAAAAIVSPRADAHMRLETKVILPARARALTPKTGRKSAARSPTTAIRAFPIDNDEEFRQLFARILNLAPRRSRRRPHRARRPAEARARTRSRTSRRARTCEHVDARPRNSLARRALTSPSLAMRGAGARHSRSNRQPGSRDALGQHVPLQPRRSRADAGPEPARQPQLRRRRPQLQQRLDRHQPLDLLSEFDLVWQRKLRLSA